MTMEANSKEALLISAIEDELMDMSVDGRLPLEVRELIDAGCLALMAARNKLLLSIERDSAQTAGASA